MSAASAASADKPRRSAAGALHRLLFRVSGAKRGGQGDEGGVRGHEQVDTALTSSVTAT